MSNATAPSSKDVEAWARNAAAITGAAAAKMAAFDTEIFLPHDPQRTSCRGPIFSFSQAVIAGWRQYGHVTMLIQYATPRAAAKQL
jgi:hypothetical protein